MTTISDFKGRVPEMASDISKSHLLERLSPVLKQKMYDAGGDIFVDYVNNAYTVSTGNAELDSAIMADLALRK